MHPYEGERFVLMQNGTDHQFHHWGIIEGYPEEKSDSYMLLKYVERHCKSLEDVVEVFDAIYTKVDF